MWPVTDTFLAALREAHTMVAGVDAYYGGELLVGNLPIEDGQVTVHGGTGVRRTLDLTISDRSLWDTLDVVGVELRPWRGIRYPSGQVETVPLGVFDLSSQAVRLSGGGITVSSAPDRWARVQRARFERPAQSVRTARASAEAARLVVEAAPGVAVTNEASSSATAGQLVWDRDRDRAVIDLLTAISAEGFFDNEGAFTIRDAPLLSQPPVWTVDASPSGVLLDGDRVRDRSRTYNVVVVADARVDGSAPFALQVVADTDPASRTYVGGPFGRVPYFWSSPTVRTAQQAAAAGRTILNRVKAVNAQLSVQTVVNPALDRGDVIHVLTPGGVVERHLVDGVTIPLTVGGAQSITTRSSRPEGDVPGGE